MTSSRAPTLEKTRLEPPRGPRGPGRDRGDWQPGRDGEGAAAQPVHPGRIAVWLVVASVTILFAAFTSTYLARRTEPDWQSVQMPAVLWLNTGVLVLSSLLLEWARRGGQHLQTARMRTGLALATAFGLAFLAGQIVAWRQLAAGGVFLSSNPHSSFFYLLTGAHGLHLAGGLLALFYAVANSRRVDAVDAIVEPVTTYWHFLGVLWLYLFVLLFWI